MVSHDWPLSECCQGPCSVPVIPETAMPRWGPASRSAKTLSSRLATLSPGWARLSSAVLVSVGEPATLSVGAWLAGVEEFDTARLAVSVALLKAVLVRL